MKMDMTHLSKKEYRKYRQMKKRVANAPEPMRAELRVILKIMIVISNLQFPLLPRAEI